MTSKISLVLCAIFLIAKGQFIEDQENHNEPRVKRGAAVYTTFPTSNIIRPQVTKNPQDFINAIGANNNGYRSDSSYGGNLLSQYQQSGYGGSSSSGGRSGSYRKRRSAEIPNYNLNFNPYLNNYFENNYEDSQKSNQNFRPYSPNPINANGLLQAATASYNGHAAVFKAYTARTPYFGFNSKSTDDENENYRNERNDFDYSY